MNTIPDDEIDLIELLQNLWKGKWLIAGMAGAAAAIGATYVALTPNYFDASITIRPIDAAISDQFRALNNTVTDTDGTFKSYFSAQDSIAEFAEVLLQRDTLVRAAIQNDIAEIDEIDSPAGTTLEMAMRPYAFDVEIVPVAIPAPSPVTSTNEVTGWRITWTADDEGKSDGFISDILSLTSEVVRQRLLQRLSAEVDQFQREQMRRKAQIETEIANAIQDYQVYLNDQLAYLSEQASLARVLGIEFGIGTGTGTNNSTLVRPSKAMTYLDGYQAVEEQIAILSSREQIAAFVPGLRALQSELRTLEQNTTSDELVEAIAASPISDMETFRAAQYDLASIELTYHKKTGLILALSLVLGGFVGVLSVLVGNAISARKVAK